MWEVVTGCVTRVGETCGLISNHQQSKQILGGGAGMVGIGLLYS